MILNIIGMFKAEVLLPFPCFPIYFSLHLKELGVNEKKMVIGARWSALVSIIWLILSNNFISGKVIIIRLHDNKTRKAKEEEQQQKQLQTVLFSS